MWAVLPAKEKVLGSEKEQEEDDGVHQDGRSRCLHVAELNGLVVARYLHEKSSTVLLTMTTQNERRLGAESSS